MVFGCMKPSRSENGGINRRYHDPVQYVAEGGNRKASRVSNFQQIRFH